MVRQIASDLAGMAVVVQVETDKNPRVAGKMAISGIPALLLFKNSNVIDRMSGARSRENVVAWVRRHMPRH